MIKSKFLSLEERLGCMNFEDIFNEFNRTGIVVDKITKKNKINPLEVRAIHKKVTVKPALPNLSENRSKSVFCDIERIEVNRKKVVAAHSKLCHKVNSTSTTINSALTRFEDFYKVMNAEAKQGSLQKLLDRKDLVKKVEKNHSENFRFGKELSKIKKLFQSSVNLNLIPSKIFVSNNVGS